MEKVLKTVNHIIVNTGNILSLNDLTKKPGQNPTEELTDAMNITIKDFQNNGENLELVDPFVIYRQHDDLTAKISDNEISELKIGLKVFLTSDDKQYVVDALDKALSVLQVNSVQNVIMSYNQVDDINKIQNVWKVLEEYTENKKISQIGIADVEESTFRSLHEWALIKPSIIQINLATCCVVPPTLQAFCKDHEVQLLTHSDPTDILPHDRINQIFSQDLQLNWVLRFLVHIKCRGVLATKGYLISLRK
ncbi:glutamate--cysteine ligase regulatory subunit [Onthophagus taurus]|uniref:glutamate--cysteine ligase regulatory subunit n=1 Tax=Onthophagus taurus TaxID=166361 RepID=UPI000C207C48|nr:glutamate--cysteine ligase regulatory subunit [Onthophagus taurus]